MLNVVDSFLTQGVLFWVMALATCGSAIAVVISQSVVRMAFWLIVCLGSTAGLFFLLGADFVGTAQLLVYVGGTVVLLIFGVMLTASGPFLSMKTGLGELTLAAGIAVLLLALILGSACSVNWTSVTQAAASPQRFDAEGVERSGFYSTAEGSTSRTLGFAFLGIRTDKDLNTPTAAPSTGYLLPFEIASVHLLLVLIGAAYLARAKRRLPIEREGSA